MKNKIIMLSAGEPSGDRHAAGVVSELKRRLPDYEFCGLGGSLMSSFGFKSLFDFNKFNHMGLVEVLKHLPFFLNAKKQFVLELKKQQPKALVCIDFSGFNRPLAKAAHKLGVPVIWYIAPKFWAWKRKKYINFLKKYVTQVAVIFPFVEKSYNGISDNLKFVGNPLVEQNRQQGYNINIQKSDNLKNKKDICIAVVPGSRRQEILKVLPVMISACQRLKNEYVNIKVVISKWNGFDEGFFCDIVGSEFELTEEPLEQLFERSDMTIITSGTATLQAALSNIPMVICYKSSAISHFIYKKMVTGIKYVGLPNIIAEDEIVPELLQENLTVDKLSEKMKLFIEDTPLYTDTVKKLKNISEELGKYEPSKRVAEMVISELA